MPFRGVVLDELTIDDEQSLAGVALYHDLKALLVASGQRFFVPTNGRRLSWDRAVFLNLTFWSGPHAADVLCDEHIPADVVAHVAWHHAADRALERAGCSAAQRRSAPALFFAESIASAFDLYLVGRLLAHAPDSDFVATQVPLMGEAAEEAGLEEKAFKALLTDVAHHPEKAFEELRVLLFDVCQELVLCADALAAERVFEKFAGSRLAPLLHHFQLSNWVLYARAYATPGRLEWIEAIDAELRQAQDSLDLLATRWFAAPTG